MKTTYKVFEAHSGTPEKEIKKAKRQFLKKIKIGEIPIWVKGKEVEIHFKDENYCIFADYIVEGYGSVGSALIYNGN